MATAINSFWLPGALIGAFLADWIGPKWCLVGGVTLQGIVGFAMTGAYSELNRPDRVAGFIILTGVFMALGEVGPGDNIGLFASKLSSTPIRGQFYGVAAAWGKVGAFVGTYIVSIPFPGRLSCYWRYNFHQPPCHFGSMIDNMC